MDRAPKVDPIILQQREAIREACQLAERNLVTSCHDGSLEGVRDSDSSQQLKRSSPTNAALFNGTGKVSATSCDSIAINPVDSLNGTSNWSTALNSSPSPYGQVPSSSHKGVEAGQPGFQQQLVTSIAPFNGNFPIEPAASHRVSANFPSTSPPRPYMFGNNFTAYQQMAPQPQISQYMPTQISNPSHNPPFAEAKTNITYNESWNMQQPNLQNPHIAVYNLPQGLGTRDHPVTLAHQHQLQNDPSLYQELPQFASQGAVGMAAPPTEDDSTRPSMKHYNHHTCSCGPGCRCVFCIAHPYNESSQRQVAEASRTLEANIYDQGAKSSEEQIHGMYSSTDPRIPGSSMTNAGFSGSGAPPHPQHNWANQMFTDASDSTGPIQTMDSSNYFHVEYPASEYQPLFAGEEHYMSNQQ
ncbi:MAG: hypothetical protein Q9163_003180 [Psora crenata]